MRAHLIYVASTSQAGTSAFSAYAHSGRKANLPRIVVAGPTIPFGIWKRPPRRLLRRESEGPRIGRLPKTAAGRAPAAGVGRTIWICTRGFADVVASLEAGHGGTLGGVWGSSRALVAAALANLVLGRSWLLRRIRGRSMRLRAIWRCSAMRLLRSFRLGRRSRGSGLFMMRFMGSGCGC